MKTRAVSFDMRQLQRILLSVLIFSVFVPAVFPKIKIETIKADTPPAVDGILNEAIWKKVKGYTGFVSFVPEFGRPSKEKTIVYCAYDADNLYFAFKCYAGKPDQVISTIRKRDSIGREDHVAVSIDSHNDGQNAYFLGSNALGVQMDGIMDSEGYFKKSQDFVWESAGKKNAEGYSIEIKVPFESLRFARSPNVKMGVAFFRYCNKHSEEYVFPEWKLGKGAMLGQLGEAEYPDIKNKKVLEIIPELAHLRQKNREKDTEQLVTSDDTNLGLTSKIGLTSDLTLDLTVNPDYSHIETDAGEVYLNLRVLPYYSEKRPFFLEGLEHLDFAGCGSGSMISKTVNTRKIVDPVLGLKLSGKMGKSGLVNALFSIDESPKDNQTIDSQYRTSDYYGIVRYKHLLKNNSYIGGLYSGKYFKDGHHRLGGLDTNVRLNGFTTLKSYFLYSHSKNPRSKNNCGLREGTAFGGSLSYENRHHLAALGFHNISDDFTLAAGRLLRNGYRTFSAGLDRYFFTSSNFLKKITLSGYGSLSRDTIFNMNEHLHTLQTGFQFSSNTNLSVGYNFATEIYEGIEFDLNQFFINASSTISKTWTLGFGYEAGDYPDYYDLYQGEIKRINFTLLFQPGEKFSTSFSLKRHIFHDSRSGRQVYDMGILRNKTVYHLNKYLSLRTIVEYNTHDKELFGHCLAEFTYIPGTVIYLGYDSTWEKRHWLAAPTRPDHFRELRSGFFFKASYRFRF